MYQILITTYIFTYHGKCAVASSVACYSTKLMADMAYDIIDRLEDTNPMVYRATKLYPEREVQ